MIVYDSWIMCCKQVPTQNIPVLIQKFAERTGQTLTEVPQRIYTEQITRKLAITAGLQCAEVARSTKYFTVDFYATQEGDHVNGTHLTTKTTVRLLLWIS